MGTVAEAHLNYGYLKFTDDPAETYEITKFDMHYKDGLGIKEDDVLNIQGLGMLSVRHVVTKRKLIGVHRDVIIDVHSIYCTWLSDAWRA